MANKANNEPVEVSGLNVQIGKLAIGIPRAVEADGPAAIEAFLTDECAKRGVPYPPPAPVEALDAKAEGGTEPAAPAPTSTKKSGGK